MTSPSEPAPTLELPREKTHELAQLLTFTSAALKSHQQRSKAKDRRGAKKAAGKVAAGREALRRAGGTAATGDGVPRPLDRQTFHQARSMASTQTERTASKEHLGRVGRDTWAVYGHVPHLGEVGGEVATEQQADALIHWILDPATPLDALSPWLVTDEPVELDRDAQKELQKLRGQGSDAQQGRVEMLAGAASTLDLSQPGDRAVAHWLHGISALPGSGRIDAALRERVGAFLTAREREAAAASTPAAGSTRQTPPSAPTAATPASAPEQSADGNPAASEPLASLMAEVWKALPEGEVKTVLGQVLTGTAPASSPQQQPQPAEAARQAPADDNALATVDGGRITFVTEEDRIRHREQRRAELIKRFPRPDPWAGLQVSYQDNQGQSIDNPETINGSVVASAHTWPQDERHEKLAAQLHPVVNDEARKALENHFEDLAEAMRLQQPSTPPEASAPDHNAAAVAAAEDAKVHGSRRDQAHTQTQAAFSPNADAGQTAAEQQAQTPQEDPAARQARQRGIVQPTRQPQQPQQAR